MLGMEVHQVFGTWSGAVRDDGVTYRFNALQGFAEEARNRWRRGPAPGSERHPCQPIRSFTR